MGTETRLDYITLISQRGDDTGGHGGLLDLLGWCGKMGVIYVSEEEARQFYEDPETPYEQWAASRKVT